MRKQLAVLAGMVFFLAARVFLFPHGEVLAAQDAAVSSDSYGNPIDWEPDVGNEEGAGLEEIPVEAYPQESYSFTEQQSVEALMESARAEDPIQEESGWLYVKVDPREGWEGGSVLVTFYRGSKQQEVWLYRQNGWEAGVWLPEGTYTFGKAVSADGKTRFDVPGGEGTFEIRQSYPVSLILSQEMRIRMASDAQAVEMENGPPVQAGSAPETENEVATPQDAADMRPDSGGGSAAFTAVILMVSLLGVSFVWIRRRKNDTDEGFF